MITIGITAYREGELLRDGIRGMLSQRGCDWRGIVVLDGGHDSITRSIVESIADPRVEKIILSENIGPYPTREIIFERSTTDIILHCDGDDILRPDAARIVAEQFTRSGAAYAGFGAELHYPDGEKRIIPGHATTFRTYVLENDFPGYVLFRKSIWQKYGRYNRRLLRGRADFEFILKLIGNEEAFTFTEDVIIDKREFPTSVGRSYPTQAANKAEIILEDNRSLLEACGVIKEFLGQAYIGGAWNCYRAGKLADSAKWARKLAALDSARPVWPLTLADRLPPILIRLLVNGRFFAGKMLRAIKAK